MTDHPAAEHSDLPSDDAVYQRRAQLYEEIGACYRAGRQPDPQELARRYPEFVADIPSLVRALGALEQGAPSLPSPSAGWSRALPCRLGEYELIEEIARGGMGV